MNSEHQGQRPHVFQRIGYPSHGCFGVMSAVALSILHAAIDAPASVAKVILLLLTKNRWEKEIKGAMTMAGIGLFAIWNLDVSSNEFVAFGGVHGPIHSKVKKMAKLMQ